MGEPTLTDRERVAAGLATADIHHDGCGIYAGNDCTCDDLDDPLPSSVKPSDAELVRPDVEAWLRTAQVNNTAMHGRGEFPGEQDSRIADLCEYIIGIERLAAARLSVREGEVPELVRVLPLLAPDQTEALRIALVMLNGEDATLLELFTSLAAPLPMETERSPHVYVCDKCGADYHHNEQGQAVKHALEGHAACSGCNGDTTHCGCIDSDEDCDRRPNCLLNVFPAPSPASVDVGEARKLADQTQAVAQRINADSERGALVFDDVRTAVHQLAVVYPVLRSLSTALEKAEKKLFFADDRAQKLDGVLKAANANTKRATDRATAAESALETEQAKVKGLERARVADKAERETMLAMLRKASEDLGTLRPRCDSAEALAREAAQLVAIAAGGGNWLHTAEYGMHTVEVRPEFAAQARATLAKLAEKGLA